MNVRWKTITVSLIALAMGATAAVGAAHADDRVSVGGIIYARDSQFWQQIERGMQDAAEKYGADLQVGLNRRQLATEGQVVEDFVTRGVDVIVMPPLDRQASVAAARRAKERGTMIVDYDAPLADDGIASHTIGVDSHELAATVGREIRSHVDKELSGAATIGLITLPPTNPNMQARRSGLLSGIEGSDFKVVAEVAAATPEQGANAFENILQRDPATQVIWASNSGSLAGAAAAARRSNAAAKLYGIDMSQELAEMLLDPASNLQAVSDQQPYRIGFTAVETAVKSLRGEPQPRNVTVPVRLYTKRDPAGVNEYLELVKSLAH
ncbi:sugar ABC transporter substrate-binding protein [Azospirillum sp. ST 5-10]|uniref:sugar ABC transporter substrate-binding protein n=1 Tax=unclassified Azospirillum TaxID=2630922 RepID=UPI003F4A1E27